MNFEFKSTFINQRRVFTLQLKSIVSLIVSKDYSIWISAFNIAGFVVTGWLYLNNYIIPATYGSGPKGDTWVSVLKAAGHLWALTTTYTLLRVTFLCWVTASFRQRVVTSYDRARIAFRESIYVMAFQCFMLINVFINGPKAGRPRLALALHPATHLNFIIIK